MNKYLKAALIHIGLFVITCITTTLAGAQFVETSPDLTHDAIVGGMVYAGSFLFILAVHEFGHYFTAVHNKIKTSLPYFIPLPPQFLLGTMGAVIRIRDIIRSKREHFDIGIAGPIAGFIAALLVLTYGFTHLPPASYVDQFHVGIKPGDAMIDIVAGKNLMFLFFEKFVADPARVPGPNELIHYPLLFAGFLALVFTSLNLLPIGQLDGGHVLYGLVGYENHRKVASVAFAAMLFFSGLGFVNMTNSEHWVWRIPITVGLTFYGLTGLRFHWQQMLILTLIMFIIQFVMAFYFPTVQGYPSLGLFLLIIRRFVGIEHPQAMIEEPLSTGRKILGWIALVIFILCLTPVPFEIIESVPVPTHGA